MALVRCMSTELEKGGLLHRRSNSGGRLLEEIRCAGRHTGVDDDTPTSSPRTHAKRAVSDQAPRRHRLSQSSSQQSQPKDAVLRRTVVVVALSVVATTVVILVSLLALATAGPTAKSQLKDTLPGNHHGRMTHLLAEGLSSVASKLDPDAVEEYAPPRGYIRKALDKMRGQLSEREKESMSLQAYYDSELATLRAELEQQRKTFEGKLRRQELVLSEVFGDEEDIPHQETRKFRKLM